MNSLATVVASYGLLANSTAVVIGAMIIAALMGPIMGLALAMVDGDEGLLRKSILAEAVGAALVFTLGLILGKIHGDIGLTNEILSRTKPNLLDLAVAVAGGAAGAYAMISPRLSVGLVGVAISTALVPPLAACGICVAHGEKALALGAFLLFATNLVAIQCASSIVMFFFGFHHITRRQPGDRSYIPRIAVDGLLFAGLFIFLTFQLKASVAEQSLRNRIRDSLSKGLREIPGAYLNDLRFRVEDDRRIVVAVVHTPNSITPDQTATLQRTLAYSDGPRIELHVRSLLTKETTAKGYLHVIDPSRVGVDDRMESGDTVGSDSSTAMPRKISEGGR